MKLTIFFNNNNRKLYLINDELIEISYKLIDYITENSSKFKIVQNLLTQLEFSKEKIRSVTDLESYFIEEKNNNFYGFYPKLVTENDLSKLSQIELATYGEGFSYYNTNYHKLYFLKRNQSGFYWDEGQSLVGMPGPIGEPGKKGENGLKGEKGDPGVQGPAFSVDFIFPRPIEDLIISQITLNKLGENKFVFCSNDGKIYVTKMENNNVVIEGGWEFVGMQGHTGEKGEKGEKGDQGEKGDNAQVINIDEYVDYDPQNKKSNEIAQYNLGYTFLNTKTGLLHFITNSDGHKSISQGLALSGPRGVKGDKGERGEKGDQGNTGDQGMMGLPGPPGLKGEKGEMGDVGPAFNPNKIGQELPQNFTQEELRKMGQGYSYFCVENGNLYFVLKENNYYKFSQGFKIKGERGLRGEKGDQGNTGEKGEKGERGNIGKPGEKGDRGERGDKGEKGEKGERGNMGLQGPAFSPDFRLAIDPHTLSLEQLENYGEGTAILSTLDGKLYFIHMYEGQLTVSKGYEMVGIRGDMGEKGEKGETGPRGLQGLPGKMGDSYFVYNENRNLSYKKGGISIGNDVEILGNESLRIGQRYGDEMTVVYEGLTKVFDYGSFKKTINNDEMRIEGKTINLLDKLFIGEKIDMNIDLNVKKIEGLKEIESDILKIKGLINAKKLVIEHIDVNNIKTNEINLGGIMIEIDDGNLVVDGNIKLNKIELEGELVMKKMEIRNGENIVWNYDDKHNINGNVVIDGKLDVEEINVKNIRGNLQVDKGNINEVESELLKIGNSIFSRDNIEIRENEYLIDVNRLDIRSTECRISVDGLVFGDELTVKKSAKFEGVVDIREIYIKRGKIDNLEIEKGSLRCINSGINLDNVDIEGQVEVFLNGFVNLRKDELIIGKKLVIDNGDFYFHMSEKNWIRIKDDIMMIYGNILSLENSEMRVRNGKLRIDEGDIEVGDDVKIGKNGIKSNLEAELLKVGNMSIDMTRMEMRKYEMEMVDGIFKLRGNGGELISSGNELEMKNWRMRLFGEMEVNDNFCIRNDKIDFYNANIFLDKSSLNFGTNLFLSNNLIRLNNISVDIQNGEIMNRNMLIKSEKVVEELFNCERKITNGKMIYINEGKERIVLEKNGIKLRDMVISGENMRLKLNDSFALIGKQLVSNDMEWLINNVKIDYQDGKININPTFMKLRSYKFVIEGGTFLHKDDNSTLLVEKGMLYCGGLDVKFKDSIFEWLDKNGAKIIEIKQNVVNFWRTDINMKNGMMNIEREDINLLDSNFDVRGGKIILENYRIGDVNKTFGISDGKWDWQGVKMNLSKVNYKSSGSNFERLYGREVNKSMELEFTKSKFNWNDEKNKPLLFMGDKLMQINFPVVEYIGSDINYKTRDGVLYGRISDGKLDLQNASVNLINSKFILEKNGFPILGVNGEEVSINNVPLKLEDSYINYLYARKNAQLLLKNDLLHMNYIDLEVKNGHINWNNGKVMMIGNSVKMAVDLQLSEGLEIKNKRGNFIVKDNVEIEDISCIFKRGKLTFMEIKNNICRLEGASLILKGGTFYNECFTLEENCLKIENALFKQKRVDIRMEEVNMELDANSLIKIGISEIGDNNGLIIKSKSNLRLGNIFVWEGDGQHMYMGGYTKWGGKVLFGGEGWEIVKKDDMVYHNGKLYHKIDKKDDITAIDRVWDRMKNTLKKKLGDEFVRNIGGDMYMEQMAINRVLMEKIALLEEKIKNM